VQSRLTQTDSTPVRAKTPRSPDTGGDNLAEAFEHVVEAMFGYMTELDTVDATETREYQVQGTLISTPRSNADAPGHDLQSLLYALMDEFLFIFSTELFVVKRVTITEFDTTNFRITATG
jgi:SHS2 domain-containing protein